MKTRYILLSLFALPIIVLTTLQVGITTAYAYPPPFDYFTNNVTAISNGQIVVSALLAGDSGRVQAFIGSEVVFIGYAPWSGGGTNITVESNIVLNVELQPSANVTSHGSGNPAEVLGTLKSVDFQKRVIYIRAKPKDYWKGATL